MPKHQQPYPTEVALCEAFIKAVPREWTAYAETEGWDILLARKADGFQIGIEAKLKIGVKVINQAIEENYRTSNRPGPDCRAILVPETAHDFGRICDYIGLTIIAMRRPFERGSWGAQFSPSLPSELIGSTSSWHEWCPAKRHALPEYVPDVAAGASAPIKLTQWKIAAIKIMITLETRGYVTREDFTKHCIDHRRWLARETGWLAKKDGAWVKGEYSPGDFRAQHPRVYAQLEADADKWMPKVAAVRSLFEAAEKGKIGA